MQPIHLRRTKNDLLHQYDCLIQIQNYRYRKDSRGVGIALISLTVFVGILYVATPANSLIVLKGVSLMLMALGWVVMALVALWFAIKRIRLWQQIKKEVEADLAGGKQHFVTFSEEGLIVGHETIKSEVTWDYYTHYLETPTTVVLFLVGAKLSFNAYTSLEMGEENLAQLKTIVRAKLPLLNEEIHLKDRIRNRDGLQK